MKISAALASVSNLYVETAPFIYFYFVERNAVYIERVRDIFRRVAHGSLVVQTSVITLTEVLMMPIQMARIDYERAYRSMLLQTRNIEAIAVSSQIADDAARLRALHRLRTPDALHMATAL